MSQNAENIEKKRTNDVILKHLRDYGMNARIAIVYPNPVLRDAHLHDEGKGLLRQAHSEFTAANPKIQITHKSGGVVRLYVADALLHNHRMIAGIGFSMIIFESIPTSGNEYLRELLVAELRFPPMLWVESSDGLCEVK